MTEPTTTTNATESGVMFRVSEELFFLPASIAMKVMGMPEMAPVPGSPPELGGIALVDGEMIAVVDLSTLLEAPFDDPPRPRKIEDGTMLVCSVHGEVVALVGLQVVATGRFPVDPKTGEPVFGEEPARLLDVGGVIARVREGRWAV